MLSTREAISQEREEEKWDVRMISQSVPTSSVVVFTSASATLTVPVRYTSSERGRPYRRPVIHHEHPDRSPPKCDLTSRSSDLVVPARTRHCSVEPAFMWSAEGEERESWTYWIMLTI